MDYKVELFPSAIKELKESAHWYEKQSQGLGMRFIGVIYEAFGSIELNPDAYLQTKTHYKEFVVDTFSYIIVYEIVKKNNMINVLHVFHTSRNNKLKYKRKK